MKLFTSALLALLPFTVLAAPTLHAVGVPVPISALGRDVSPAPPKLRILARSNTLCKVVNSTYWAHCHPTSDVDSDPSYYIFTDIDYLFTCYVGTKPKCIDGNCTMDKLVWDGGSCYVSGYYTDDRCSVATLGAC